MNTVKSLFSFPQGRVQNDMLDSQELHGRVLTFRIRNHWEGRSANTQQGLPKDKLKH